MTGAIEQVYRCISVHFGAGCRAAVLHKKALQPFELQGFESGTPKETRTPNLLIRSQTLYPIELWVLGGAFALRRARAGKKPKPTAPVKEITGTNHFSSKNFRCSHSITSSPLAAPPIRLLWIS
jgi:hypothetical protein